MQNRIGILRREKGWSLTDLARAAGTTKAQIQKLERGERRLSLDWMRRLAAALEVKMSDLLPSDAVACQHGPEEQKILEIVSQLPAEDRLVLVRIATDLLGTLRREGLRERPSLADELLLAASDVPAPIPLSGRRRREA
ncbi:MAG TPA: helix-turn-helix transcriptional regulator [Rhizomicrobium sp.]|nr:helix-turn-helix transcriptional regulator [Rhizomicrobium sp.]